MNNSATLRGVISILAANMALSASICLIKLTSQSNPYMILLYRFGTGIGIIGLLALSGKVTLTFVNKKGLFIRGILGGIALLSIYVSVGKLGVIKSSIIINMYPVFAMIFSVILLKERIGWFRIVSIAAALCGLLLVLSEQKSDNVLQWYPGIYELLCVCGALLGGLAVVSVKKLHTTDTSTAIFYSQCLIGFLLVLLPAGIKNSQGYHEFTDSILMVTIGICAAVGQLVLTSGYRYIKVSTGSLLTMSGPVFTLFAGIFVFGEPFTTRILIGSIIILGSCASVIYTKKQVIVIFLFAAKR